MTDFGSVGCGFKSCRGHNDIFSYLFIFTVGQDLGITGLSDPLSFVRWLLIIVLTFLISKILFFFEQEKRKRISSFFIL